MTDETRKRPVFGLMPPAFSPGGAALRALVDQPARWRQSRRQLDWLGYWATHLDEQFDDVSLERTFRTLRQWRLPLSLEVRCLKEYSRTSRMAWVILDRILRRLDGLGCQPAQFSLDEPWYATRHILGQPMDYAVKHTTEFILRLRERYPHAAICSIEPYPVLKEAELIQWVEALHRALQTQGDRGLDAYRLDVDWASMGTTYPGDWQTVRRIGDHARKMGLKYSLIYWAATVPALAARQAETPHSWPAAIRQQADAVRAADAQPDELVLESWMATPARSIPETDPTTLTGILRSLQQAAL